MQARVEAFSPEPTQLHVKVVAYLLTSEQVFQLHNWDPNSHVVSDNILGGTAEQSVLNTNMAEPTCDGGTVYKGSCTVTFRGDSTAVVLTDTHHLMTQCCVA